MSDEANRPKLEVVPPTEEELDEEEREFRALRRDLPGVKGASAVGIVAISVDRHLRRMSSFAATRSFTRSCRWSTPRWEWKSTTSR
jgi:hypothetical protein